MSEKQQLEKIIRSEIGITGAAYGGEWIQDQEGMLWINFSRSLAKYDGIVWTVYTDQDLDCEEYLQDAIPSIAMDGSGKLWFKSCKLWTRDNNGWEKIHTGNSGLTGGEVRGVVETTTGDVWFATSKGIIQKKNAVWVYYPPEDYHADENVSAVTTDSSGNMWFGTNTLEVLRFDGTTWTKWDTLKSIIPENYHFNSIVVAPDGSLWLFMSPTLDVGFESYAVQFQNDSWTVYSSANAPFQSGIVIRTLRFDNNGTYWFHTSRKIVALKDGIWTYYDESNSLLPGKDMYGMSIDPAGKPWICSFEGLYFFENDVWHFATDINNRLPLYLRPDLHKIDFDVSGKLYLSMSHWNNPFSSIIAITDSTITSMVPSGYNPMSFGSFTNIFYTSKSNRFWVNQPFGNYIFEYNPNPPMFAPPPEIGENNGILAYPNPTTGDVSLLFDYEESGEIQINIFDVQGQLRSTLTEIFQPGHAIPINIQDLSPGLYNLQAFIGGNMLQGNLIRI